MRTILQTGKFSDVVSFMRRTTGSIPFRANEYHKIGSVPFQSMTAFFHLRRKSLVKLRYYIRRLGTFTVLGSDVANMSMSMTASWCARFMIGQSKTLWVPHNLRTSSSAPTPKRACAHAFFSLVTQSCMRKYCVTSQYSVCKGDFSGYKPCSNAVFQGRDKVGVFVIRTFSRCIWL